MKIRLSLFVLALSGLSCFLPFLDYAASAAASSSANGAQTSKIDEGWARMPEGGKSAFMGIQGGTMPVSLLVATDGSSLLGFVGQTGNDFLEVLRNAYLPFPSFGNSTGKRSIPLKNAGVFAGNSTASLPVFNLPDDPAASRTLVSRLFPFGLSPLPLSIEGNLEKPETVTREKKFRNFYLPDNFQATTQHK